MTTDIKWRPAIVVNATKAEIAKRMKRAMLIVQGDTQRRLSVGTATRRTKSGRLVAIAKADPAPTAPRALTGALRTSITHDVQIEPNAVVGRVGSNLVYARRLELGSHGKDGNDARPYLRPALFENKNRILARLVGR